MRFFLGTHMPNWLATSEVPLFVSHRRLKDRKSLPRARTGWALDSGGFSELSMYGQWETTPEDYVTAVQRYRDEVGLLEWAAPQDWMCEPHMLAKTGLTVADHQRKTVENYLTLRSLDESLPFVPVLQGWTVDDYHRHVGQYDKAGVDLTGLVGVGSVCRRQATGEIHALFLSLQPLRMHGFGVKTDGLSRYAYLLESADSMAWSYTARNRPPLAGCSHRSCANCHRFALVWRERVLRRCANQQLHLEVA